MSRSNKLYRNEKTGRWYRGHELVYMVCFDDLRVPTCASTSYDAYRRMCYERYAGRAITPPRYADVNVRLVRDDEIPEIKRAQNSSVREQLTLPGLPGDMSSSGSGALSRSLPPSDVLAHVRSDPTLDARLKHTGTRRPSKP